MTALLPPYDSFRILSRGIRIYVLFQTSKVRQTRVTVVLVSKADVADLWPLKFIL